MKKMFKKIVAVAAVAFMGMVGTASAADYYVNMCGASAQADFWTKAGESVVQNTYSCSAAVYDHEVDNDKNKIIRGTGCTVGSDTNATIYVRYLASNSDGGCNNYDLGSQNYVNPGSCSFTPGDPGSCTSTVAAGCMLGCADVPCDTLCASTTNGWENGYKGFSNGEPYTSFTASCIQATPAKSYTGVIVPFGFIVNNKVTHHVCDYENVYAALGTADVDWAYNKEGWQCDPTPGSINGPLSCRGDFKCLDGVCQDGEQDSADPNTCTTAADCKYTEVVPTCVEKPLDNVSRLMVLHIFSHGVDNWSDFGPGFPDLAITQCMRHSGSGTHQTLLDTVIDGKVTESRQSIPPQNIWHYKSSSDLTKDCVARFDGGIGYVDADKAMWTEISSYDGAAEGIHQLKYQGTAPSRYDVAWGKYNFWAAQTCFRGSQLTQTQIDLIEDIMTQAALPQYLGFDNFNQSAYFWTTKGEMKVEKANNDPASYPSSLR